jgi:hypothetical protein
VSYQSGRLAEFTWATGGRDCRLYKSAPHFLVPSAEHANRFMPRSGDVYFLEVSIKGDPSLTAWSGAPVVGCGGYK